MKTYESICTKKRHRICKYVKSLKFGCLQFFLITGNLDPPRDLISKRWCKNDPINEIAGLETQIKDLFDEKNIRSTQKTATVDGESDLESREDDYHQQNRDTISINSGVNSQQYNENDCCNRQEYSLLNNYFTKVCEFICILNNSISALHT